MSDDQWIKFVSWIGFVILVPLVVYPAALIIAGLEGKRVTLGQALELGDLLFLVVAMLAGSTDFTLQAYLAAAKGAPVVVGPGKVIDYVSFLVTLLLLLVYAVVYGRIVLGRLMGTPIPNLRGMAILSSASYIGIALLCGGRYFRLLYLGLI
jgi:hypothetical protein